MGMCCRLRGLSLVKFVNLIFTFVGVIQLGMSTYFVITGDVALATLTMTAGLIFLLAATIDRFESLKGLGIEAKTKQLDVKINEADEALNCLQEMIELSGFALIDLNSKMGRWDSAPSPSNSIAFANRVRELMNRTGLDKAVINKALEPWACTLCLDMGLNHVRRLQALVSEEQKRLNHNLQQIPTPIDPSNEQYKRLHDELRLIGQYGQQLSGLFPLSLNDYPEKLLSVYENVPIIDSGKVGELRNDLMKFIPGMYELRNNKTLTDVDMWLNELSVRS